MKIGKKIKNKHIISFTPEYCWTDESVRAHSFTCVMALLFYSLLRRKVSENKLKLSGEEIINNLRDIRQSLLIMPKSKRVHSVVEKMNSTQKNLYSVLNLNKYGC